MDQFVNYVILDLVVGISFNCAEEESDGGGSIWPGIAVICGRSAVCIHLSLALVKLYVYFPPVAGEDRQPFCHQGHDFIL